MTCEKCCTVVIHRLPKNKPTFNFDLRSKHVSFNTCPSSPPVHLSNRFSAHLCTSIPRVEGISHDFGSRRNVATKYNLTGLQLYWIHALVEKMFLNRIESYTAAKIHPCPPSSPSRRGSALRSVQSEFLHRRPNQPTDRHGLGCSKPVRHVLYIFLR